MFFFFLVLKIAEVKIQGTTHDLFVYVDAGIVTCKLDRRTSPIIGNFQALVSICPRQGFLRNRIEKANAANFRNNYALNVVAYATLLSIPYNRVKFNIKFSF